MLAIFDPEHKPSGISSFMTKQYLIVNDITLRELEQLQRKELWGWRKISNAHKIIWPRRTALKRLLDIQSSVIRTSSPYLNSLITLGASEILHISNLFFGRRVNNFTIADGSSFNYDVIIIISDIWVMKPEIIWGEKSVCISYNVERLIDHPDWFVIIHCEINQIRDKPKNLLMTQFTYTLQWED